MEKVIEFLSVGLQVFCQKSKAAQYLFFALKPQGNNRQLVSRLGIAFHDVGFPAATGNGFYFGSSLFRHFFLQKTANIFNIISRNFNRLFNSHRNILA